MIHFFSLPNKNIIAVKSDRSLTNNDIQKLGWLFGKGEYLTKESINGPFIGPKAYMVTPWSTNAVEITQNMGVEGIVRIESFTPKDQNIDFDPMLFQEYELLHQTIFDLKNQPEPIIEVTDITSYNQTEGLSLNNEEINYLETLSKKLNRPLTDTEIFGFSQINSEHCRHKIFNGEFILNGQKQTDSLFSLIKKTTKENGDQVVSAYKDNVAFLKGPQIQQFSPKDAERPSNYSKRETESIISLKAETHNFPTTVEPFSGAATGSGGEIRDRLAGGQSSNPLAGTAVYMTSYPRFEGEQRQWVDSFPERPWLYQSPLDILIKASNGASDFGNKFGQPLITGSLLTFEHQENNQKLGFDKVIMLAGGVGEGRLDYAQKRKPKKGDKIIILGGDNYRIGMGGAAVSSVDTGGLSNAIELNAVQRSNPEMQKRVANVIRAMMESDQNDIISIHDHGAGGHLNCLSELLEETGGTIYLEKLPIGDTTLSAKEILGNESQERMGLIISSEALPKLIEISHRERAPIYEVGEVTGDGKFTVISEKEGKNPIELNMEDLFGNTPKITIKDQEKETSLSPIEYDQEHLYSYLESVLKLESVACKDWLTNKVDRCVTGRVAKQPCTGPLQLPLNNCGVISLDYEGQHGIATATGSSPISGLISPESGARNSVAEALTNIVWSPAPENINSVSLSVNWMWPCNNEGEDYRLYQTVHELSKFCIELGIPVPTGKDSLSMTQKYKDHQVASPGTVIVSAAANCESLSKVVEPTLQKEAGDIYYLDLSSDEKKLGGSAFAQILNKVGTEAPSILDSEYFKNGFNAIQSLIKEGQIVAGHDISSGGLITTLLEMCFADLDLGAEVDLSDLNTNDNIKLLFSENSGIIFQLKKEANPQATFKAFNISPIKIGMVTKTPNLEITNGVNQLTFNISQYRALWYHTSYLFDKEQSGQIKAGERKESYTKTPLKFKFPNNFNGKLPTLSQDERKPIAGVLREKGSNSEREMAHTLYLSGFEVRDIHMTDLISGRETLEDVQFLAAVGGFSNSDVLGSAKGWAGSFLYNEKAKQTLTNFFARKDTLSIGVCNGCQLFVELGLLYPELGDKQPKMAHNESGKFECIFTSISIPENNTVMLSTLANTTLGIWAAHGEGSIRLSETVETYNIIATYGYNSYPANPNGSDYNAAAIASKDGRHVAIMPHLERSIFPWNWGYYPFDLKQEDAISPWLEAFVNAKKWLMINSFDKD